MLAAAVDTAAEAADTAAGAVGKPAGAVRTTAAPLVDTAAEHQVEVGRKQAAGKDQRQAARELPEQALRLAPEQLQLRQAAQPHMPYRISHYRGFARHKNASSHQHHLLNRSYFTHEYNTCL